MLSPLIEELTNDSDLKQKISVFVDPYFSYIKNFVILLYIMMFVILIMQIGIFMQVYRNQIQII